MSEDNKSILKKIADYFSPEAINERAQGRIESPKQRAERIEYESNQKDLQDRLKRENGEVVGAQSRSPVGSRVEGDPDTGIYYEVYYDENGNEISRRQLDQEESEKAFLLNEATKKANNASKKKKSKTQVDSSVDFDDQSFLVDYINLFSNDEDIDFNDRDSVKRLFSPDKFPSKRYKNFLQIEDDQPLRTTNRLLGLGINSFRNITTAQLSSIVPYFRLYRVFFDEAGFDTRIEFPFNKFTSLESITSTNEGRGSDVGFLEVNWDDTAGHPGNTGLSFKGNLKIHFQSFEAIFKKRLISDKYLRFSDILHQQSAKGKKSDAQKNRISTKEESAQSANVNPGRAPEIHMECGWSFPPRELFEDVFEYEDFVENLTKLRRTYIITPFEQQLDFKPNGEVELTVEFAAAIEGRSFSAQTDLLRIDENNYKKITENNFTKLKDNLNGLLERSKKIKKDISESKKSSGNNKITTNALKEYQNELKQINEKVKLKKSQIREVRYSRFLTLLRQGLGGVRYVDLNLDQYELYKQFLVTTAEQYSAVSEEKDKELKKIIRESAELTRYILGSEVKGKINSLIDNNEGVTNENATLITSQIKKIKDSAKKDSKQKKSLKLVDGNYRLSYVFLGDLLEVAMNIIYNDPDIENGKLSQNNPNDQKLRTDVRLCLGSFSYVNASTGKTYSMALADLPVSLNYFNSWWYDNVISKNKDRYALRTFLMDFCGKLLNNLMSPKRFGGTPTKPFRFKVMPIFTKKDHPLDEKWKESGTKNKKDRIDIKEVMKYGSTGSSVGTSQWLYVYVEGGETRNSVLKGNIELDEQDNIPHFSVGAETGVVLNISFSKTKIPGKRESLLYKSVTDGTLNSNLLFTDRYDANLELIGNPAFKPGQLIYIDTRSLGLGRANTDAEPYMYELGIGGYYRIIKVSHKLSSEGFITSLDTISEFSSREIAKNKIEKGEE